MVRTLLPVAALAFLPFGGGLAGPYRGDATMTTGATVAPPGGFVAYCLNFPSECGTGPQTPALIDLRKGGAETLDRIQSKVNADVLPRINLNHLWEYPDRSYGDCNSYALEKKRALIAQGLPRSALLLTVAITETNDGHLVLTARTTGGDLVLDNRVAPVMLWTQLPYRWLARQSETDPAMWVEIVDPPAPLADAGAAGSLPTAASGENCKMPGLE